MKPHSVFVTLAIEISVFTFFISARRTDTIFSRIHSCALQGIHGAIVDVEVDVRNQGLPAFDLVGLPDAAVREARERVTLAIKNSAVAFPEHRIVVNLAPADVRKEGSAFDLAIAIGLMISSGQVAAGALERAMLVGELSLDGQLRPVPGVLSMAISAKEQGYDQLYLPLANAPEAALLTGITIYAFHTLKEVLDHLNAKCLVAPYQGDAKQGESDYGHDFTDIQGQQAAKRALEIAAAGGHNVMMIGGPGAGKTLMARSLPSILPRLSFEESLQITQIYSVASLLKTQGALLSERPFRAPHHTISHAGLIGGGSNPRPGEVSLAHHGVLFLDELPEFRRDVLELLRQPLEDRQVTIARVSATYTFPASFMLVASMNPCPCGFLGDSRQECSCRESEIRRYQNRISGPLLDRIDLQVEVPRLSYEELNGHVSSEPSRSIRVRVEQARERQRQRLGPELFCNAQMHGKLVRTFCKPTSAAAQLLQRSFDKLHLTARAHDRVLKVARTIADLEGSVHIDVAHIAEAIGYRSLDKRYFG